MIAFFTFFSSQFPTTPKHVSWRYSMSKELVINSYFIRLQYVEYLK